MFIFQTIQKQPPKADEFQKISQMGADHSGVLILDRQQSAKAAEALRGIYISFSDAMNRSPEQSAHKG